MAELLLNSRTKVVHIIGRDGVRTLCKMARADQFGYFRVSGVGISSADLCKPCQDVQNAPLGEETGRSSVSIKETR